MSSPQQQAEARRDKLLQPFPAFIKVDPLHLVDAVHDVDELALTY
jgi:hypothetical protein